MTGVLQVVRSSVGSIPGSAVSREKVVGIGRPLTQKMWISVSRLLGGGGHVVQKALAAGLAWWLATTLLGHQNPAFAAIAAIISIGAAVGREGRQAVELVFGVACGLAVADLLVSAFGSGPIQIGLVVALATAAALLLGKGELLVNEAAISALLMLTLVPFHSGMLTTRFLDALVGSGTALVVRAVFPSSPKRMLERAARPIFSDLASTLAEVSASVGSGDLERAEAALEKARRLDDRVGGLKDALEASHGSARLSPPRRRTLGRLGHYETAAGQLDLAVRNTRVLARAAVAMVRSGKSAPEKLSGTIQELSMAVEFLSEYVERPDHPLLTRELALEAAKDATAVLEEQNDLDTNMLVGQIRSTTMDLLQASGMNYSSALQALHETTQPDG